MHSMLHIETARDAIPCFGIDRLEQITHLQKAFKENHVVG